ncbi:MAG: DUF5615 family PIN-like protein [Microcystis sp. M179S2]|nr:DUF5615 family PIN-like protein [Microcystis sp. M179S2]MCA2702545.1 DUF5615 family PIN-like protein [Microcystis sp. M179S2]
MPTSDRSHKAKAIALDEGVSKAIAKGLRMRGIDVTMSSEERLIGASDQEQLVYALSQGRVVFTFHVSDIGICDRQ